MKKSIFILLIILILMISACKKEDKYDEGENDLKVPIAVNYQNLKCRQIEEALKEMVTATIDTNYGNIVITLFQEDAPLLVDSFIKLADEKYYEEFGLVNIKEAGIGVGKMGDPDYNLKTGTGKLIPVEIVEDFGMVYGSVVATRRIFVEGEESWNMGNFAIIDKDYITEEEEREIMDMDITEDLREAFKTIGGDIEFHGELTVFGQVIKGMEVIEEIRNMEIGALKQPIKWVQINNIKISK